MINSPPRTIGKYKIIGTLGRGAMGMVYKAQDPEIGRIVAVKVLRKLTSTVTELPKESALERFKIEARAAGNLRHPHIITIFEVNTEEESPFIVMDYIEGEALDEIISRLKRLPPQKALIYLEQVASGLDYAHTKGVIHRDIKPSNILVDKSDHCFILDFGVASIAGQMKDGTEPVMGTPSYMSPEQIFNKELDYRSDLFSLAVVSFEVLTGTRPFAGNNFTSVVGNILAGNRFSLSEVAPNLPLALDSEFERAFSKEKEDRFSTAAEMISGFRNSIGVLREDLKPKYISEEHSPTKNSELDGVLGGKYSKIKIGLDLPVPKHNPGSMFSGADSLSNKESLSARMRRRKELYRSLSLVAGIICLGLALFLIWIVKNPPTRHNNSLPLTSREIIKNYPDSQNVTLPKGKAFPVSEYPPPNQGKQVEEMTSRELLGVIASKLSSEKLIIESLRESSKRRIPNLVEAAYIPLSHDSHIVRYETLKALEIIGDKDSTAEIIHLLDDIDSLVRLEAARALGILGDRRGLGYLTSRLLKEENKEVKREIQKSIDTLQGFSSEKK